VPSCIAVNRFASTAAHAGGPVMQVYFLGTDLVKERFAATMVYFFLLLNFIKWVPFIAFGRFSRAELLSELWVIPLLPVGVILGFQIVRRMPERSYRRLINLTLALSSSVLIWQGIA
jgi:uncharacterized membrane protein YfcA